MAPSEPDEVEKVMGEELLLRLLDLPPEQWTRACASVCRRHPEHEHTLHARVQELIGAGALLRPEAAAEKQLGPYRLLQLLGTGGQGSVFLAEDTRLRRQVAVKVLSHAAALSERARQRLRREAEILGKLDHPGICTVFEIGEAEGAPYVAMRWIDGESLATRLARHVEALGSATSSSALVLAPSSDSTSDAGSGRSSARAAIARVVRPFERAARALHAAHEAGIVHRDVKPGNLMVTASGDPVLLDFGLAQDEEAVALTGTGDVLGTPAYMSPEQVEHLPLDRRTDVYSLAATMYECLTGERPFVAPTRELLYRAILAGPPPSLRRRNAHASADLEVVLATALETDRARRYQTALDFADDLAAVLESRPIRARKVSELGKLARWGRRKPALAALLALAVVAVPTIATLGGYMWASWPDLEAQRVARAEAQLEGTLEQGYAALADRHFPRATEAFAAAAALAPERPEVIAGLSFVELRQEQFDASLAVLDAHRDVVAAAPWLNWLRVFALRKRGDAEGAARIEALLGEPDTDLACFCTGLGLTYLSEENDEKSHRKALDLFTRAILLAERPRLLFYSLRAETARLAKDEAASRQTADALLAMWPESAYAWLGAAGALLELDLLRAIKYAQRAREIDPSSPNAAHNLGVALGYASKHEEAAEAFRAAADLEPDAADHQGCLAAMLESAGDVEGAVAAYERALERDERYLAAYENYGTLLAKREEYAAAEAMFRRGLAVDPSSVELHYNLGLLAETTGRHADAAAAYARTVELAPRDAEAHERLLAMLHELKDEASLLMEEKRWQTLFTQGELERR